MGFAMLNASEHGVSGMGEISGLRPSHAEPTLTAATRNPLIFLQTISQNGTLQAVQILLSMLKTNHLVI